MTPVIHCFAGNIRFFPAATFIHWKDTLLTKLNVSGNHNRLTSPSQGFLLPQASLRLFQIYRNGFLRLKGLASADKKVSRATAEGRIGSYVRDRRIGVLIEVNCETDFVSRGDIFKQLVEDLAMQVAACPQVRYLVTEDVPQEIVNKEREIEMQKEDLLSKPENSRSKVVDGWIRKRLEQFALLEQPYIKNDKIVVKDLVKQTIATIGENIKISRFICYNLGEGLEKKSQDFAAEVAAQTAPIESPAAPKDRPVETKEDFEKPPAIAVSAALVKQLREETGAGMMDCKKSSSDQNCWRP